MSKLLSIALDTEFHVPTGGGQSYGRASSIKLFWKDDVTDMCQQLGIYQKNVSLGKEGSKKALDDFVAAKYQLVEKTVKVDTHTNSRATSNRAFIRMQRSIGSGRK